jgi:hypothetical protein
MPRPQYSHLDNEGVKGLVDSICSRMRTGGWHFWETWVVFDRFRGGYDRPGSAVADVV